MQKLEMCIEVLKFAIEFVIVFVEAVGSVINQTSDSSSLSAVPNHTVPYIGLLP
ncbi:hypothetical protein ACP275_14G115900 [Erythranthe tilingii]